MLLKSLRLENIRSYNDATIRFNEGSSLLFGDIGTGKTSILLGIEFALFGLLKGDVSGTTLLRHGARDGSVELCFDCEGTEVTIQRKLRRKNDNISQDAGFIKIGEKKMEGTPVELKSKILELFGYPEELLNKNTSLIYRYTVYTPQEDMKAILFETKEERLDILRRIFNIDKYKRIRENALNYAKELRNMKRILETKISDIEAQKNDLEKSAAESKNIEEKLEKIRNDGEAIRRSLKEKADELKVFEDKINNLNILKKDLEIALLQYRNKKSEYERALKELNMAEYRIKEYNAKLGDLGFIDNNEEALRSALKDSEDKLTKINSMKELIKERLEAKKEDLQNIIIEDAASLKAKYAHLTNNLKDKSEREKTIYESQDIMDKINIDINTLKISRDNSEKTVSQLKDLNTCPVCLQQVDFSHKIKITDKEILNINFTGRQLTELEKKKTEAESTIRKARQELEQLRHEEVELKEVMIKLEHLQTKIENKKKLEQEIDDLTMKQQKIDAIDVNTLMENISKNRKILNNIEIRKHVQESLKEKEEQKKELDTRIKDIDNEMKTLADNTVNINKKISEFSDIERDFSKKKTEKEAIEFELRKNDILKAEMQKDNENIRLQLKKLREEIEIKTQVKNKIIHITDLNHWLTEHFINLTSTIEKTIMQKVHMEFNELFRKWFNILMEEESIDVRIDEEFTPIIMQNNYETYIENLSGGEKTAVALAYRLALNRVINDFINTIKTKELIILDEPTDGFSTEQLDKMREVFEELNMGQMIIVSHETKMETYVQNIIKITKNEHSSKIMT